jgi:ribosomal protein S18 acetylase RimI-like enzyme
MNDEILDTVWGWIHDAGNPFFGLIARDENGQALGLMHCRQMPSPLRGALVGFLDDLFVIPQARGQGVVEALYQSLNALGKEQGWPFIRWITADNNYRGRAVYDKLSEKTHWVTYQMAVAGKDYPARTSDFRAVTRACSCRIFFSRIRRSATGNPCRPAP